MKTELFLETCTLGRTPVLPIIVLCYCVLLFHIVIPFDLYTDFSCIWEDIRKTGVLLK